MKTLLLAGSLALVPLMSAHAEEQTIKLKLLLKILETKDGVGKAWGAIVQDNGRVGAAELISRPVPEGSVGGKVTYQFEDGTILIDYSGKRAADGHITGTDTILSGTGHYDGVTGTGTFDGLGPQASPVKGMGIFDHVLTLDVPKR